ncbi:hypothetical protein [Pseudoruegeria aquimaris]|nr:hypothetical protein [Pseudoruegeria aquimaris]
MVLKERTDLLSTLPGALIAWGLPIAAMILAIGIPHPIKTWCRVALNCEMGIQRNQRLSFALKYEILPLILIFLPLNLRQGSQTFAANIDE